MAISISERAEAVTRAKKALAHLEAHPLATTGRLGAARDQLNLAHTLPEARDVWEAIQAIESNVLDLYGHDPDTTN